MRFSKPKNTPLLVLFFFFFSRLEHVHDATYQAMHENEEKKTLKTPTIGSSDSEQALDATSSGLPFQRTQPGDGIGPFQRHADAEGARVDDRGALGAT